MARPKKVPESEEIFCRTCMADYGKKRIFSTRSNLARHVKNLHLSSYVCNKCSPPKTLDNGYDLENHIKKVHGAKTGRKRHLNPFTGEEFRSKREWFRKRPVGSIAKLGIEGELTEDMEAGEFSLGVMDKELEEEGLGPREAAVMTCPYCGVMLESRTGLLDHVNYAHSAQVGAVGATERGEVEDPGDLRQRVSLLLSPDRDLSHLSDSELRDALLEYLHRHPSHFFTLIAAHSPQPVNRFGFASRTIQIILNQRGLDCLAFGCTLSLLESIFNDLISQVLSRLPRDAKANFISLSIESSETLSFAISTPYVAVGAMSVAQFLSDVSMVGTSRPAFMLDEKMRITVSCLGPALSEAGSERLFGGAKKAATSGSQTVVIMRRKGFAAFAPNVVWDNDCGLVALHLALLIREHPGTWRALPQFRSPLTSEALKIAVMRLAAHFPGIDWTKPQPVSTAKLFQDHLNHAKALQLVIYDVTNVSKPYYKGYPNRPHDQRVNLIFHSGHLSVLDSVADFFRVKECFECLKIFPKGKHPTCYGSKRSCKDCKTVACVRDHRSLSNSPEECVPEWCESCHCLFRSKICMEYHQDPSMEMEAKEEGDKTDSSSANQTSRVLLPVCKYIIQCLSCGKKLKRASPWDSQTPQHQCLVHKCQKCGEETPMVGGKHHYCTIQKANLSQLGITRAYASSLGLKVRGRGGQMRGKRKWDSSTAWSESAEASGSLGEASVLPLLAATEENLPQTYSMVVGRRGLVFFDYETRVTGSEGRLVPFALAAVFMCSLCAFHDYRNPDRWLKTYPCCGQRVRRYAGLRQIKHFILTLFFRMKKFHKVIAFAFNSAAFDSIFIADVLVANGLKPELVMRGRQILSLAYSNVIIKDLRLYLSGSLAALPKNFSFDDKLEKGFFPHQLSNIVDVYTYTSKAWPSPSLFSPHMFKNPKAMNELVDFLDSKKGQPFNFMEECLKYSVIDCQVLALATLSLEYATLLETKFQISFIYSSTFTIAGLSSIYFRHMFMAEGSLGLTPPNGYVNETDLQSGMAQIYFRWLNFHRKQKGLELIKFSKSSIDGEFRVFMWKIDGYTKEKFYEFDSCFHHAATCCYGGEQKGLHPIYKIPYSQVRYLDQLRKHRIQKITGKEIITISSCFVEKFLKANTAFKTFYDEEKTLLSSRRNISIRDCLFGGRVENFALYVELSDAEIARGVQIHLYDIVSLYPSVQFDRRYPLGLHPTIIDEEDLPRKGREFTLSDAKQYFGIFSVFIVPPTDCLYPSVVHRVGVKSLYGLCRRCMEMMDGKSVCRHTADSERGFHATLNSIDLELCLEDGYRCIRVYQIWDWGVEETTTELFKPMIAHLIRGKVQSKEGADDIPAEKRAAMVAAWQDIGIDLSEGEWRGSPARYQFYKVLLNSLWGKLAQRQDHKTSTKIINRVEELMDILNDGGKEITHVHSTASDGVVCQVKNKGEHVDAMPGFYHPFIASLVTSYARETMTRAIRSIGPAAVFYMDTDSVIFKHDVPYTRPPPVSKNKLLGSLVSELPAGHFIKRLLILAPKSYIYEIFSVENPHAPNPVSVVLKMKGMGLNYRLTSSLSMELLRKLAFGELGLAEGEEFFRGLGAGDAAADAAYAVKSAELWRQQRRFTLPQPTLRKLPHTFGIREAPDEVKSLGARFQKRILAIPHLKQDLAQVECPEDDKWIPSFPYGYKSAFLGNLDP